MHQPSLGRLYQEADDSYYYYNYFSFQNYCFPSKGLLLYLDHIFELDEGKKILEKESLWEPIFMAPAHSFDCETLKALKKNGFEVVLDGFSLSPYEFGNLKYIPQISSKPLPKFIPCISQLCIHINTISPREINKLIFFIEQNHKEFISLKDLQNKSYSKKICERIFISQFIKTYRIFRKSKNLIKVLCNI